MATQYIVTQLWSPRHIVTRGFGAFVPLTDLGQSEIVELGDAHVNKIVSFAAEVTLQKNLTTHVTNNLEEVVYVARGKGLIARVLTEPGVLVER